jgi:hypothetical protein
MFVRGPAKDWTDPATHPAELQYMLADLDWLVGEIERLRDAYGQGWEDGGNATWADLHEDNPEAVQRCRELLDRADAAEIERLRGLLREIEWSGDGMPPDFMPLCPACKGHKQHGHHSDCGLAAELRST